ncbi:MAG: HAMP domain-containing histidine kinase, partial [Alphaproteobacteria bacterium]|nr:HAMP domain-containing histidine kinase [Alphaproteobacteria bacterium]
MTQTPPPAPTSLPRRFAFGLAQRILLLTIVFVMIAEIAVFVPSVANFRNNWLRDRLSAAHTAALALEVAPDVMVPEEVRRQLLISAGVQMIALKRGDSRRLLADEDMKVNIVERYDLRTATPLQAIAAAFRTLFSSGNRVIGVIGDAPMGAEFIEIAVHERPLQIAMVRYSWNILLLSLIISLIVAAFAVAAMYLLVLRPVKRLTDNLALFRENPEDVSRIISPSGARDEIGRAEKALAEMQGALAHELSQKKHLAALGLAVAKINHDLRNMLSSAQLFSDRLASAPDPLTRRLSEKLVATLDRAISFCQSTLAYGRAIEHAPRLKPVRLAPLVQEAADVVAPQGIASISIINNVAADIEIAADSEQVIRVFINLFRNAAEALENAGTRDPQGARIRIEAQVANATALIEISDNGPGV